MMRDADAEAAARIAAQLARERNAEEFSVFEIGRDAVLLVAAGAQARAALTSGDDPAPAYRVAAALAAKYGATVDERGDLAGMVLGVRFRSGAYSNGAGNVFYVC